MYFRRFHVCLFFVAAVAAHVAAHAASYPVLTYSTYLRDSFTPNAIATDAAGNVYLAGNAIVDPAARQITALVVKLNPQGTEYVYVRYLGGSVADNANAIAVDAAGNVYVAGSTDSPDFPVTSAAGGGTAPSGMSYDGRSFVTKLDVNGNIVFSDLLGGSTWSMAQAVTVTASGQVLVSGESIKAGFPSTSGAYSVPDTTNRPYLVELDPSGSKVTFSATGIGGSAIVADAAGNIYVAGTTYQLDYPTTPGAYQTTFPMFYSCLFLCQIEDQGANQYVTKVNASGSKLIYSTSVSGTYNTWNTGMAVDGAGNVYLTGYAGGGYPYTVTPPAIPSGGVIATAFNVLPFLTRLDPLGQTLVFSVPVGGAGVQVDSNGHVYAGGGVGSGVMPDIAMTASLPALASVPAPCLPNAVTMQNSAYVAQVDSGSGNVLGAQYIGGSTLTASAVALTGSTLWMAGATTQADIPMTPNALTVEFLTSIPLTGPYDGAGPVGGAYLGAVDFSQPAPPAGTPQIGCVLNAANLAPVGAATRYELLAIFGSGLGPATGVNSDGSMFTVGGTNVNFGGSPAPILYASATQINLAAPLVTYPEGSSSIQVLANGVFSAMRQLALTYQTPTLFLNTVQTFAAGNPYGPVALALNADGSANSLSNPAALGSVISVFVNGLTQDPQVNNAPLVLTAPPGYTVTNIVQATPFVVQVSVQLPASVSALGGATGSAETGAFAGAVVLSLGSGTFSGNVFVAR